MSPKSRPIFETQPKLGICLSAPYCIIEVHFHESSPEHPIKRSTTRSPPSGIPLCRIPLHSPAASPGPHPPPILPQETHPFTKLRPRHIVSPSSPSPFFYPRQPVHRYVGPTQAVTNSLAPRLGCSPDTGAPLIAARAATAV
ncbi:uncharacterized protein BDZ99DRAFT_514924 [Mytilinidion resinicola]|uniref:Uncharacterized protein n=1 Tax=Mytilinidion resinicola TaxID=574789 RepID=A0A6A6Z685_9PEZI|nr:uncharacterized protein BDZ99DRAFT_514924 [Mytilinidion resinicola]KAF2816328.1 hypothetical protein BDZ99DRAFT_514924 [Mytilinidion resinicola]